MGTVACSLRLRTQLHPVHFTRVCGCYPPLDSIDAHIFIRIGIVSRPALVAAPSAVSGNVDRQKSHNRRVE